MYKKKILFVIHGLNAGGAEKSLVSLLNSLPLENYDIDLMAIDPTGIFRDQIPHSVNLVDAPVELVCQSVRILSRRFWRHANVKMIMLKFASIIGWHLYCRKTKLQKSHDQYYNEIWKRYIPGYSKSYDIAISYIDYTNYYVIDHIKAKKKILWCHNDYNKLEYIPDYDYSYYKSAYKICTISELCKQALISNFPKLIDKFEVVENISSARIISVQATMMDEIQTANDGFLEDNRFKLVSVGRLSEQKGFDYAIDAAKIMKDKGVEFCWYVLGEGALRKKLEEQIRKNNVNDCIKFIGIRSNPYPYIRLADIYVMPSRYEGKSIALDEAKILCKPIVVTNYPSVFDAIEDGKNGLIVKMDALSIAETIMRLHNDTLLQRNFINNLESENCSNEKQVVAKFLKIIN